MIEKFKAYCLKHQLASPNIKTLIGVSGGVDSVVLSHLFKLSEWPFAIAHCNFQLRDTASDLDASFCEQLANKYNTPFHSVAFETNEVSKAAKTSIQVTARNLRYQWFEQIRLKHSFDHIATAHHINDRIETFLYNFTKGTSIRGLRSIPEKNGHIIRPLLFASKADILAFAKKHELDWRTDESNHSTKYNRNKIRIEAVPVLKAINPSLEQTAAANFDYLKDVEKLYLWAINEWQNKLLIETDDGLEIDLNTLNNTPAPSSILYEILKDFGFLPTQVEQILSDRHNQSGAQFFTTSHRLLVNRDKLLISKRDIFELNNLEVYQNQPLLKTGQIFLNFKWDNGIPAELKAVKSIAYLDQTKLKLPLILRRWKAGDHFCPLGMNGKKQKLKDFFINQKISIFDKESTWILTTADDKICWIINHRIDERFKITSETGKVLEISMGTE